MQLLAGLLIPFAGTTLGSAMVFFMRGMHKKIEKLLLGFASGVMIAASVWSLLIPAIDMAGEQGQIAWIPAAGGFLGGMAFLLVLDSLIPHLHLESTEPEGVESSLKKTTMLVLAVTLHNIPEGMSVGVTFAGALIGDAGITMAGAFALAVGIAIQNFPEGDHFHATSQRGSFQGEGLCLRGTVRHRGTHRRFCYDSAGGADRLGAPGISGFCGGGDDLCGGGGADSRSAGRGSQQCRNRGCGHRVCGYDDFGCGFRVE